MLKKKEEKRCKENFAHTEIEIVLLESLQYIYKKSQQIFVSHVLFNSWQQIYMLLKTQLFFSGQKEQKFQCKRIITNKQLLSLDRCIPNLQKYKLTGFYFTLYIYIMV